MFCAIFIFQTRSRGAISKVKFNRNIFHNRFHSHNFRNADNNDYDIPP